MQEKPKLKLRAKKPLVEKVAQKTELSPRYCYEIKYSSINSEQYQHLKNTKTLEEARAIVTAKQEQAKNTNHRKEASLLSIFKYQIIDLKTGKVVN